MFESTSPNLFTETWAVLESPDCREEAGVGNVFLKKATAVNSRGVAMFTTYQQCVSVPTLYVTWCVEEFRRLEVREQALDFLWITSVCLHPTLPATQEGMLLVGTKCPWNKIYRQDPGEREQNEILRFLNISKNSTSL